MRLLLRGLPWVGLVIVSLTVGARAGRLLPHWTDVALLAAAILLLAGFHISRSLPGWNAILLASFAVVLGAYAAVSEIGHHLSVAWIVAATGLAVAAFIGIALRPQRGVRLVFSLAIVYIILWILAAAWPVPSLWLRGPATIGWVLFVTVGAYVFGRAAREGAAAEIPGLIGDLLVVSANLLLTSVVALGASLGP